MKQLPHLHIQAWFLLLSVAFHITSAQQLVFTSYYVTSCVDPDSPPQNTETGHPVTTTHKDGATGPGHVSYTMPECLSCGCETCTLESTFTTCYPAFCPGKAQKTGSKGDKPGITEQTYTVTETYVGMSSLPEFASATDVPFGFTTSVATCTACGQAVDDDGNDCPVVETMTFPQGGSPFASDGACAEHCDDDEDGDQDETPAPTGDDSDGETSTPTHSSSKETHGATHVANGTAPAMVPISGAIIGYSEMNRGMALLVAAAAVVAAM